MMFLFLFLMLDLHDWIWLTLSFIHSLSCIYRWMTARYSQRFVLTLYLPVTPTPVWGFSFLSVTIINVSALTGVFIVPLMKSRFGKYALTYFIALAIGTLFSTAILQLLPEVWHRDMHAYMQTFDFHTLVQRLSSASFMALPSKINQCFPPDPLITSWCNSANAYSTVINAFHGFIKNTKKQLIVRGLVGNLETVWPAVVYKIAALWPSSPLSLLCS